MLPTFTHVPDYQGEETHEPRIRAVRFGDGYEQRAPDGLNPDLVTWSFTFEHRSKADVDEMNAFFQERGGVLPFYCYDPDGTNPRIYVCPRWTRKPSSGVWWTLTATFREVRDEPNELAA
jgi:phage-related protein